MCRLLTIVVACLGVALVGCGDNSTADSNANQIQAARSADETAQKIADAFNATSTDNFDFSSQDGAFCSAPVVMTDAATVKLYRDAGDTVITTRAGNAGIKVIANEGSSQAECAAVAESALADL